jgi:hypothetical protein
MDLLQHAEQKTVLHEAGISTLAEIREQHTARIAIKVITNGIHPLRSYFMNNKIHHQSNQYSLEQYRVNYR